MSALFYTTPSHGDWNRALPIGNGKLGAMIFGEGTGEHFQLNEDSVCSGRNETAITRMPLRIWTPSAAISLGERLKKQRNCASTLLPVPRRASTRIRHWEMSTSITAEN